ncbi:MAG: nucleotide exchange factor GrpE, partial [Candidatus Omnitrophica bacterium]|nr:nucleotide exchange factor GrpE [Candidatus Omnitrophota bacterium]
QARTQALRLQADFENARKRWLNEQAQVQERANADVLARLLEIFDDFERAVAVGAATKGGGVFLAGVEMIAKRMDEFLKSYGIAPIESVGKPFDPERHEAVAHEPSEAAPESTVVAELRRGYTMNGQVLRHAVVKVAVKGG